MDRRNDKRSSVSRARLLLLLGVQGLFLAVYGLGWVPGVGVVFTLWLFALPLLCWFTFKPDAYGRGTGIAVLGDVYLVIAALGTSAMITQLLMDERRWGWARALGLDDSWGVLFSALSLASLVSGIVGGVTSLRPLGEALVTRPQGRGDPAKPPWSASL